MNAPARIDAPAAGSPNRFRLRVADYLMLHEGGSVGVDVRRRVVVRMWGPRADGYAEENEVSFGQPLASATIDGLSVETAGL